MQKNAYTILCNFRFEMCNRKVISGSLGKGNVTYINRKFFITEWKSNIYLTRRKELSREFYANLMQLGYSCSLWF